jgi:hypothetical protein
VLFAGGVLVGTAVTGEQPSEKTVLTFTSETEPGTLAAAFTPAPRASTWSGRGSRRCPEGKVYELWLFTGDTPASAMCATPTAGGSVFGFADTSLEGVGLMAVTVESSDCPSAPTTQPVFTAEVTA